MERTAYGNVRHYETRIESEVIENRVEGDDRFVVQGKTIEAKDRELI